MLELGLAPPSRGCLLSNSGALFRLHLFDSGIRATLAELYGVAAFFLFAINRMLSVRLLKGNAVVLQLVKGTGW